MLNESPFELVTAGTDFLLGLLCLYIIRQIKRYNNFKSATWTWTFSLLMVASFLGSIAHGFALSTETNGLIWQPLNLSLGLTLGFFVVGAAIDLFGERRTRKVMPAMIILGIGFYLVTLLIPNTFRTFIVYEGLAMLFALSGYAFLSMKKFPGAMWTTLGLLVTVVAAVIQAIAVNHESIVWYFDNNGIFHATQMAGILLILKGLKTALDTGR
jgi:hypothetical protein